MKKYFALMFSTLMLAPLLTHAADQRLVPADDSALSAFCVAAAEAPAKLNDLADTHGIDSSELPTILCNGRPLQRFVSAFRSTAPGAPATRYSFSKRDESELTELCLAAVSSRETYAQLKQQRFGNDLSLDTELLCNGMPVTKFVRRYRNDSRDLSAALR